MCKKLIAKGKQLKSAVKLYKRVIKDKRTPLPAKIILGLAVGYMLMPFDIIPDFIPVIGHIDDAVIVPLLVFIAFKMIPKEVVEDYRLQINNLSP
ncbi:MAG: DUF1232 domain-containing protein [Nitrospirae bacterium]|nr:DUF1232 domain-containing protein [Nitrospirota bacterium]